MAKRTNAKNLMQHAHDPVIGAKASPAARQELVETLYNLLQTTVHDRLSGTQWTAKIDICVNYLHELRAYGASLKEAASVILENHPVPDDAHLSALCELADVMVAGAATSAQYLDAVRQFSTDLDAVRGAVVEQANKLYEEI